MYTIFIYIYIFIYVHIYITYYISYLYYEVQQDATFSKTLGSLGHFKVIYQKFDQISQKCSLKEFSSLKF